MTQFPANIDLSNLDGSNGFSLSGEVAEDQSGWSVASAGDVNGDGFTDLIIGAIAADPNGDLSGSCYVVFGGASGFGPNLELSSLDGSNGFKLSGVDATDQVGWSVASAGDVNGDGFADVIVGSRWANSSEGASYLVFGKALGFTANLDLSELNGRNGFRLRGNGDESSGFSVASAGDVNGDGFIDMIVGAPNADPNGKVGAGAGYLVFGKASFGASIKLSDLDGSDGFKLSGAVAEDRSGWSVASAGDVNGDGLADLIVGAPGADTNGRQDGATYVVFGRASGFGPNIELSSLDGSNGFKLSGVNAQDESGWSVASAGDLNGDGFADLVVGTPDADSNGPYSGASYVVFGKASGFAPNLDLSSLDGSNGFKISGVAEDDRSGWSVASAGDVNGDGFDDLIIGAWRADPNGDLSGASYVVLGNASGFAADLDPSNLDGTSGFRLSGVTADDFSGYSVASAGDVNGDGFADLIVGAHGADPNGSRSGASYVVFGRLPLMAVNRAGTDASQTLAGGDFDDTLSGVGGDDRLYGNGGADTLDGGDGTDMVLYTDKTVSVAVTLNGASVTTVTVGGVAEDTIRNVENVSGGLGNDRLTGDGLSNILRGNAGNDTLDGGAGNDTLNGGQGDDALLGRENEDTLDGGAGNDTLNGGSDKDTLHGGEDDDKLNGGSENDMLNGGAGKDVLDGGIGHGDTALYTENTESVLVKLKGATNATVTVGGVAEDTIRNVENVTAGLGDDRLTGDGQANILRGNAGDDRLDGGGGSDRLFGGTGRDVLRGGSGADQFVFNATLSVANSDVVRDFAHLEDTIVLNSNVFSALAAGVLSEAAFRTINTGTSGAAQDADDRIIYNANTGGLFYDSDGRGGAAATRFATLTNADLTHPVMIHEDFLIV